MYNEKMNITAVTDNPVAVFIWRRKKLNARGQPKRFNSGAKLIQLFSQFCDYITDEACYEIIPSQTEFCKWLSTEYGSVDRKTIYNSLNKYFPAIKSEFERLQSDVIAQGGMLGKYQSTMSIFVLKNWCKWEDKPSAGSDNVGELKELVNELKKL